jgi:gas vesicle protein
MRSGEFWLGLMIGATAGAVAGLLLAPQSGSETREAIKERAAELKGRAVEEARRLGEKVGGAVREKAEQVSSSVRARLGRTEEAEA